MSIRFNKALFYREIIHAKWLGFLFTLELLLIWISEFNKYIEGIKKDFPLFMNNSKERLNFFSLYHPYLDIVIISVIIIAVYLIGVDRQNGRLDSIISMPFKKSEIILTKLITGLFLILLPIVVIFGFMTIKYLANRQYIIYFFQFKHIVQWAVLNFLTLAFILIFIMLMQCVILKPIAAGVIGAIFLQIPQRMSEALDALTFHLYLPHYEGMNCEALVLQFNEKVHYIGRKIIYIGDYLSFGFYNRPDFYRDYTGTFTQRAVTLLIIELIATSFLVWSFKRIKAERNNNIAVSKSAGVLTILVLGIYFIIIAIAILSGGAVRMNLGILINIAAFTVTCIIYCVLTSRLNKALKKSVQTS